MQTWEIAVLYFKRNIRTWTGIWTSDLQISSLALYHPSSFGSTGLNFYLESNSMQSVVVWHRHHLNGELITSLLVYSDVLNRILSRPKYVIYALINKNVRFQENLYRIPVQVRMCLLKSKIVIFRGINYKFVPT